MKFSFLVASGCSLLGFCTSSALADTSMEAVQALSHFRQGMGLSAVVPNDKLNQTALGHSQYLSALTDRSILSRLAPDGTPEMHRQRLGYPKFIGVNIGDRTKKFGYPFSAGEQVVFNDRNSTGASAVEQLIATVYHRSGLLNPAWTELGAAVDTPDAVLVMGEGAVKGRVTADWIGIYPADQSTTARVAFSHEIPDPAPDRPGQWLGLPISIHAGTGQTLNTRRFELMDGKGAKVVGRVLGSKTDSRVATSEVFFMPEKPLQYAMRYSVEADFSVVIAAKEVQKNMRWSFQTPPNPFAVLPGANTTELMPGVPQTIELQGIQGNWDWQTQMNTLQGVAIETKSLGTGKMQITFPASCGGDCTAAVIVKHEGPHPSTERREFVMSKAWLAARPAAAVVFPQQLIDSALALRSARPHSALAYSLLGGGWSWNTITGAPNQKEAEQGALGNCNKNPKAENSCKLYPITAP
jgi:hypothetical protein